MNITYRNANPSDAAKIIEFLSILGSANDQTITRKDKLPTIEEEEKWITSNSGDSGGVFLAFNDDDLVGLLAVSILMPKELSHNCSFGMSVLPAFRRMGIGSQLIQDLFKWVNGKNILRIELDVFGNNTDGINLYKKHGFKIDGLREKAVRIWSGDVVDLIHMYKFANK